MTKSKNSSKMLIAFIIISIVFSVAYFALIYLFQVQPLFKDSQEYAQLINYQPQIATKPPLGDVNAPITVTAYTGFFCDACKKYHAELFPIIEQHIQEGNVRYYHEFFILPQETSDDNLDYLAYRALYCLRNDTNAYWESYFAYIENKAQPDSKCASEGYLQDLATKQIFFGYTAQPTLFIGINGRDNTVLTGPTQNQLNRTLRLKEIALGQP